jgi:hypothetical protein
MGEFWDDLRPNSLAGVSGGSGYSLSIRFVGQEEILEETRKYRGGGADYRFRPEIIKNL